MKKLNLSALALCLSLAATSCFTSCMKDDVNYSDYYNKKSSNTNNNSGGNTENPNAGSATEAAKRLEMPKLKGGNSTLLIRTLSSGEINYTVEYDKDLKSTRWVAYEMYQSNSATNVGRWNADKNETQYPFDPLLSAGDYYSTDPFTNSGYSHGHLCPSGDRRATAEMEKQTYYITNMMPQLQNNFNATPGPWGFMEDWSRKMWNKELTSNSTDTLFICRGGTIDKAEQIQGKTPKGLIIPQYFYSVELLKYKTSGSNEWQYKAIGFLIPHVQKKVTSVKEFVKSIDEIETFTGVDFFCNLPKDIQDRVEAVTGDELLRLWSIQ